MSFVIYDVETTGLSKCFDQIVQFAAVKTDDRLNVVDQIQVGCRLMPHIVPSPEALHVTGLSISALLDPALPSHYEMVGDVRAKLESWAPSLFLGFNSLSFDEEFLRHAFYQCLHDPYLTNTGGCARADVLNLCRITAALRPDVLKPAIVEGQPVFKLKPLAEANGLQVTIAHEALADVMTTLSLCRRVLTGAPEVWSQFLRFSHKASVEAFVNDEDAFLFSESYGNHHRARLVTRIGSNPDQPTRHYCLDLTADLARLQQLSIDQLTEVCRGPARPIVTVRSNAAPTLWALYDATPQHLAPFEETEVLQRVADLRDDRTFLERLRRAAQAVEPVYAPSPHVEEQLYGGPFPSPSDKTLMRQFHGSPWAQRLAIVEQLNDPRHRRLGRRLVYFERPDLLEETARRAAWRGIAERLLEPHDQRRRWRSIEDAIAESIPLGAMNAAEEERQLKAEYDAYLRDRRDALTAEMLAA